MIISDVYSKIKSIQEEKPYEAVTKIDVLRSFKENEDWYYRKIDRAFQRLVLDNKIIRRKRGEYWIPEYLGRDIEFLKGEIRMRDYEKKLVDHLAFVAISLPLTLYLY